MVQRVEVTLPSLPLIQNDPRTLAEFRVPEVSDLLDTSEDGTENVFQDAGFFPSFERLPDLRDLGSLERNLEDEIQDIDIPEAPDVPTADDIADRIDFPSVTEIVDDVEDRVDDLLDPIAETVDGIVGEVSDDLNDVRDNVETAIDQSIDDLQEDVSGVSGALASLGDTLGNVDDVVGSVQEEINGLRDAIPDDFDQAVQDAVLAALEGTFLGDLIDDPAGTLGTLLENTAPELDQDVRDRLNELEDDE